LTSIFIHCIFSDYLKQNNYPDIITFLKYNYRVIQQNKSNTHLLKTLIMIKLFTFLVAIGFLLISIGLVAQQGIVSSDLEAPNDIQTAYISSTEKDTVTTLTLDGSKAMMDIPEETSTYTGNARGYWFTAPTYFTITGLRVPDDNPGDQTIEIIKFASGPPPIYPPTNDFVSLGRWAGISGTDIISCNIGVNSGDIIGILGCRDITNSYGPGPYSTSIDGNSVTLTKMGMEYELPTYPAQYIWQDPTGDIGRVEMYYVTNLCTWTGMVSNQWDNVYNWSPGVVPSQYDDVVIPLGCPYYPVLSGHLGINTPDYDFDCMSLSVNEGASIVANDDVINYGELVVVGTLDIGNDIQLYSGSITNLSGTIQIGMDGSGFAKHFEGSTFNQTNGHFYVERIYLYNGCQFNGTGGIVNVYNNGPNPQNYFKINDPDSYFYNFYVESGANAYLSDCSYDLEVTNTTYLHDTLFTNSYTMNSSYFLVYDGGTLVINSGGTVNVKGNGPYFHNGSALTMYSGGELNSANCIWFESGSSVYVSGGDIFLEGDFTDGDNIFSPTSGSVTFDGSSNSNIYGTPAFYDLNIDKTSDTVFADSPISITNDLELITGVLDPQNNTVTIAGNWTNTAGTFEPGTGLVVFESTGDPQNVNGNCTFYDVQQVNTGQNLKFHDTTTILNNLELHYHCWSYRDFNIYGILNIDDPNSRFTANGTNAYAVIENLDQGGALVCNSSATIIVNDLVEHLGLYGTIILDGGTINISQDSDSYNMLNADLTIQGGQMNVYGGSANSLWPFDADASISMSGGGVLDIADYGIRINNCSYTLTENITSGTIRTRGDFRSDRTDFTPNHGTFEFYGNDNCNISQVTGSTLHDVIINKSTKGGSMSPGQEQIIKGGKMGESKTNGAKANTATLNSNFTITNDLTITEGELVLNGNELTVAHWCNVYGILTMDNATDILNIGEDWTDLIRFYSGSTANFTEGMAFIYGWIIPYSGCSFTCSPNHWVIFKGESGGGPSNHEPTATYGNIVVHKNTDQRTFIDGNATEPIIINGNFTIYPYNEFEIQDETIIIHGIATDYSGKIYVYDAAKSNKDLASIKQSGDSKQSKSGTKGGYLEMDNDFTLNGLLDIGDGSVLIHGDIAGSGTFNIGDGGSLIADNYPYPKSTTQSMKSNMENNKGLYDFNGTINMTGGLLEITYNGIRLSSNSTNNISGGTIYCGGSFEVEGQGIFQPTGGIVEFGGEDTTYIICNESAGNYFHNLIIDRSSPITLNSDIEVKNDITIDNGPLVSFSDQGQWDMYVGGNWTNNGGESAFDEGEGTVTFADTLDAYILTDETFYNLTIDKSQGGNIWFGWDFDTRVVSDLDINSGAFIGNEDAVLSVTGNANINSGGILELKPGFELQVDDGSTLMVTDGAKIKLGGQEGEDILVTHISTGTYSFDVSGIIEARHTIFENMDHNGIKVGPLGQVSPDNPDHRFNNCTFRKGAPAPSTLLTLHNDQVFIMWDPIFENTFGNTGSNIRKVVSLGEVTIKSPTGDFAGPEFEEEVNDNKDNRIIWEEMDVELDLKVMLEGSFNSSGSMNTDINNILPLNHPFDSNPLADWYYTGSEYVSPMPADVAEWVLVELRDAANPISAFPGNVVAKQAALLLYDGSIMGVNGSNMQFSISYDDKLFAVVRTRNHMGVISANRLVKTGGIYPYDFTLGAGQALGGPLGHKLLSGGIWGMVSGDGDGNGQIQLPDKISWHNLAGKTGYLEGDFNLNGQVNNQDKNEYWLLNLGKGSFIPE